MQVFIESKACKKDSTKSFYCLQPIVVKKIADKKYNVIDGQQRLTTIFLILKYFGEIHFSISYETRAKSKEFLENIESKIESAEKLNIDFYHFKEAYKSIKDFFESFKDKETFKNTLFKSCKVLWQEIDSNNLQDKNSYNEKSVFIRLNTGKIPLLEAEIIKALFLAKNAKKDSIESNDLDKRKKMAEFWYNAEKKSRENNDFIYCVLQRIESKDIESNQLKDDIWRIEAYLRAIVDIDSKKGINLFDYFYNKYKQNEMQTEWQKLQSCINTLSSFASTNQYSEINRAIFHYLGFLIEQKYNINDLYKKYKGNAKDFEKELFEMVKKEVKNIDIASLKYGEDSDKIRKILLLFNLEYLIQNKSHSPFAFNKYKLESYDIEHIYSQDSNAVSAEMKKDCNALKEWLKEIRESLQENIESSRTKTLIENIKKYENLSKDELEKLLDSTNNDLKDLLDSINDNFKQNEKLHTLQNLALLNSSTNRSYQNATFSKKRNRIIDELKASVFYTKRF